MRFLLLFFATIAYANDQWFSYNEAIWVKEHTGIYVWHKDARFNDYTLPELLEKAKEFGTRIIRVPVDAFRGGEEDFTTVLSSTTYRRIFEEFPVVILTMWDWSGRQYDEKWTEMLYYNAARYLLQEYKETGKTIIMGIWESDNWAPLNEQGISFFKARQRGIKRAKAELGEKGMKLIEMIEVNRVDLKGGDCVTNIILPQVKPEMVSLSSWAHLHNLSETLDYIALKVGHRNIMLGEFGLERKNSMKEEEVRKFLISRMREVMKWGIQYVVLWQMSDWANGFTDNKENEGKKMTCWFPFYRAFHIEDEPLCIEDFREIRTDQEGNFLNLVGGKSGEGTLLLYQGGGSLFLDKYSPFWTTSLEGLALENYKWLIIPFQGRGVVVLEDKEGNRVSVELREAIRLEEFTKKGSELSKVSKLTIKWINGAPLLVGGVYLAKNKLEIHHNIDGRNIEIATVAEGGKRISLPEGSWQIERIELEAYEDIENASLKGEDGDCHIIKFLPAGSKIVLSSDGRGYFLLPNIKTMEEKGWSLFTRENLQWNEEFKIFLPLKREENCRLSLSLSLPYNIVGGEFWLTGQKSKKGDWWVEVRNYERNWVRCPSIFYYPGVPEDLRAHLPPDFPSIWGPVRNIEIAWVIRTEEDDWQWSTCIISVRAKLFLDTLYAPLPKGERELYWFQDKGKGKVKIRLSKLGKTID